MDETTARELLNETTTRYTNAKTQAEAARDELHDAVRQVASQLRQVEIVHITGWTREHIRNITQGKTSGSRSQKQAGGDPLDHDHKTGRR